VIDLNELDTGAIGEEAAGERRHLPFGKMIGLVLLAGLTAAGAGAAGLAAVAGRHPSQAQVTAAGQRELAVLWQRLPAGRIFPSSVTYLSTMGFETKATRVGIAPRASCRAAVDERAAAVLDAAGCVAVLRATYADASRTALATVGIAVLRAAGGADAVLRVLAASGHGGLLPVSFPGTVASLFTGRARETASAQSAAGPYVFLYAAGYADGRATALGPNAYANYEGETATTDLATGVVAAVITAFHAPASPCADRNIRC
jgi:hypothetical protein